MEMFFFRWRPRVSLCHLHMAKVLHIPVILHLKLRSSAPNSYSMILVAYQLLSEDHCHRLWMATQDCQPHIPEVAITDNALECHKLIPWPTNVLSHNHLIWNMKRSSRNILLKKATWD